MPTCSLNCETLDQMNVLMSFIYCLAVFSTLLKANQNSCHTACCTIFVIIVSEWRMFHYLPTEVYRYTDVTVQQVFSVMGSRFGTILAQRVKGNKKISNSNVCFYDYAILYALASQCPLTNLQLLNTWNLLSPLAPLSGTLLSVITKI